MIRLVQLQQSGQRRVALVEEPNLRLLAPAHGSIYSLAHAALASEGQISALVERAATSETLDYDAIYSGHSTWRLLAPIDHPRENACCLVSGTGLTHLGSAQSRHAMHGKAEAELSDSMRMFRWGLEGGRPAAGTVGIAPEWFYKGTGAILRAPGEPLDIPGYAEDGGEEAELAGVYLIGNNGQPWRIGLAVGNEFSDHVFEKKNYLNLAGSKVRTCAIGPELVIDAPFDSIPGHVAIERAGTVVWRQEIATGEREMCHSLANIEHHHFKFETHRRPGDVHVHFFGAHSLSFAQGLRLADGDIMHVEFTAFGRALRNPLRVFPSPAPLITVQAFS